MKRSTSVQHRQAQWRERLARQEQSGQSVAAFCKSEGLAAQTFYCWRKQLGKGRQAEVTQRSSSVAPFIDLGALAAPVSQTQSIAEGFDLRLDLPGGIVLTIARH
jgi:transposase-like protein